MTARIQHVLAPTLRRGMLLGALIAIASLVLPMQGAAQERVPLEVGETLYEVSLADGSVVFATIAEVDGERVVLITSGGARLEVARNQIRSAEPATGRMVEGEYWRVDPNGSRLFFTSTGRTLAQGEAYAGTYLIVLPFVAVGLTDRFTLAAGAPVLTGGFEPFYLAPKLQIVRSESAQVSLGTLVFFFDDEKIGIAYGVGTFGNEDQAITIGTGFGFSGDDFSSQPVAMIGGEIRTSPKMKLITENYFLPGETGAVLSAGFRFIGQRFSTDVGIAGAAGDGGGCCVPLLNFSYAFGGGR